MNTIIPSAKRKKVCTVSPLNQHDFVPFLNKRHSSCVLFESRVFRSIVLDGRDVGVDLPWVFLPEKNIK